MKKLICLLMIAAFLLPLAACQNGGQGNGPTAAPGDMSFHPETDFDNRYAGLKTCDILETEDAFIIRHTADGYLRYWDKTTGEGDFLCPRPECSHDSSDCSAYIGKYSASLAFYDGQLWWVDEVSLGRTFGVFRMNLDGSGRELLHSFDLTDELQGDKRFYFHRGNLYIATCSFEVSNGEVYHPIRIGCKSLDTFEYKLITERRSLGTSIPTLRFRGDSVFIFFSPDNLAPGDAEIPNSDTDPEGYLEWKKSFPMTDEILRWDPSMDEPETIYLGTDHCFGDIRWMCVAADGTPYFEGCRLEDPALPFDAETNPYKLMIFRVEADGSRTEVMDLSANGENWFAVTMMDELILLSTSDWDRIKAGDIYVRLVRLNGEVLFEGRLPLEYRQELPSGLHTLSYSECWVTEDTMLFCFEEYYKNDSIHPYRYYFVKYDIGADGSLSETLIGQCENTIGYQG